MTSTATAIDQVEEMYAAFGRGDIAYILNCLTPDCEWIAPGQGIPNAGTYTGPQGVAEFFQRLAASEEVTEFEPREFFVSESGEAVVALGHEACRIVGNGRRVSTNWVMRFQLRDGKVSRWESFYDTSAYAAAHRG
jgi:ketosteroid isomerase-like protein